MSERGRGGSRGVADRAEAQAYSGPFHGHRWPVHPDRIDAEVEVTGPDERRQCYRLVRHRATGRPARDHHGRYLYVPMTHVPTGGPRNSLLRTGS